MQYLIMRDVNDPNRYHVHEEYSDREAFMEHLETQHFAKWNQFIQDFDPFQEVIQVNQYIARAEKQPVTRETRSFSDDVREKYCVSVNLYPKEDCIEEFLNVINANKLGTDTTESNALQYTYGENYAREQRKNTYHFFEVYNTEQGFKEHASMPHFLDWENFAETDPFTKPPDVFFARVI